MQALAQGGGPTAARQREPPAPEPHAAADGTVVQTDAAPDRPDPARRRALRARKPVLKEASARAMSLYQFFSILRARRGLAVSSCWRRSRWLWPGCCCGPPTTPRALPSWWTCANGPGGRDAQLPDRMVPPAFMATQIDIVKSERVAERVGRDARPRAGPASPSRLAQGTASTGARRRSWLASSCSSGLEVKPARESNIINIAWTGAQPGRGGQAWPTRSPQAYLDVAWTSRPTRPRSIPTWFEDQLKVARDKLEQAQNASSPPTSSDRHHQRRRTRATSRSRA